VAERVITLTLVVGILLWTRGGSPSEAERRPEAGLAVIAAVAAIGALTLVRLAARLWMWILLPAEESARAAKRSQADGLESAALALCGVGFGVSAAAGFLATAVVAAVWVASRRLGRDPVDETPFASTGIPVPAAAVSVAERVGFPPKSIIVDESTHTAARTISYHGQLFILLGPHVPTTYDAREVAVIVAHELAHVKRHDVMRTRSYRIVLCLAAVAATAGTIRMCGGFRPELPAAANPVALASGILALAAMELLCVPLLGWLSRRIERRANRWALEQTGDTDAFISAMTKLHNGLGNPPEPAWWSQLLAHEHPSLGEALIEARRADPATGGAADPAPDRRQDPVLPGTR